MRNLQNTNVIKNVIKNVVKNIFVCTHVSARIKKLTTNANVPLTICHAPHIGKAPHQSAWALQLGNQANTKVKMRRFQQTRKNVNLGCIKAL